MYEAVSLYKGQRVIASKGESGANFQVHQLLLYCACGILAGIVGGLLGLGGGFIMGPLFLELGVPPQVSFWFSFWVYRINTIKDTNFDWLKLSTSFLFQIFFLFITMLVQLVVSFLSR